MRRQVSAALTLLALTLAAPTAARADVTPEVFPITGLTAGTGMAADASGSVWFSQGQGATGYLGRLDSAQAVAGTSNGFSTYPTPVGTSCCATAIRGISVDDARKRVWVARNDGYVGYADPATMVPGTESGMHLVHVPSLVGGMGLESIAVAADGTGWFTEYDATNTGPQPWPGSRVASISPSLDISELPNLAFQTGTLDGIRYDAKPSAIAIDAAGVPWFTEGAPGNPGYRIARVDGGGYQEYLITPCIAQSPCSGQFGGGGMLPGIAVAPDGAIWFTNQINNTVGRLDPVAHTFTHYTVAGMGVPGGTPRILRTAVDGTLWLAVSGTNANAIVRILPGNSVDAPAATVFRLGADQSPYGVAPDIKGNVWFTLGNAIGRLAGVVTPGGGGGGGGTPPALVPPAPVQSTTPLVASAIGKATVGNPAIHGTSVTSNQICVGPPQDKCSLVYLLDTREYVTGFPGSKGSAAAAAKPKTRKVTVGKATVTLNGGQSKKVTIKLNAKGRKLLKSYKKLPVNFTVTQKLANGKTKTLKRKKVTFKK